MSAYVVEEHDRRVGDTLTPHLPESGFEFYCDITNVMTNTLS